MKPLAWIPRTVFGTEDLQPFYRFDDVSLNRQRDRLEIFLTLNSLSIILFGLLGGWAGAVWPQLCAFVVVYFLINTGIKALRPRMKSPKITPITQAISNYVLVLWVVVLTGGHPSPFWLLFLNGALGSAIFLAPAGVFTYSLTAFFSLTLLALPQSLEPKFLSLTMIYSCAILFTGMGTLRALALMVIERGKRMEAQAAIGASEARYRTLVDTSPDIVSLLDQFGRLALINRAGATAFGCAQPDDLIGKHAIEFTPPEEHAAILAGLETLARQGVVRNYQYLNRRVDGSCFPGETSASMLFDPAGQPIGLVAITRDITERRNAEAALREREAALSRSLQEKEALLKEIHHRVKNNMQVVSSLLHLQAAQAQDERLVSLLKDSQARVRVMAMIHEKLYGSENLAEIDCGEYLNSLTKYLASVYSSRGRGVRLSVETDEIRMGMDVAVPCGLIVNELVSNALKYAFPEERGGEIKLRLTRREGRLLLSVADDGVGFPSDKNFRRATTLGLQLVCSLVEQLSGEIRLLNERGCCFEMTFPK